MRSARFCAFRRWPWDGRSRPRDGAGDRRRRTWHVLGIQTMDSSLHPSRAGSVASAADPMSSGRTRAHSRSMLPYHLQSDPPPRSSSRSAFLRSRLGMRYILTGAGVLTLLFFLTHGPPRGPPFRFRYGDHPPPIGDKAPSWPPHEHTHPPPPPPPPPESPPPSPTLQPWPDRANAVKDAFLHAYNGYKTHAFSHDELLPLSHRYVDKSARSPRLHGRPVLIAI